MDSYLPPLCIILLFIWFEWYFIIRPDRKEAKDWHKFQQRISAFNDFVAARDRLEAWQEARPFLYISQSEYAQKLVYTMIDAYEHMLEHNDRLDVNLLENLYKLLDDSPPPDDPPPPTKTVRGGLLFYRPHQEPVR